MHTEVLILLEFINDYYCESFHCEVQSTTICIDTALYMYRYTVHGAELFAQLVLQ